MQRTPLAFSVVVLLSSCATLLDGGPDIIAVTSSPDGAKVYLDGGYVGTTPARVTVRRAADGVLELRKDGYRSRTLMLPTEFNATTIANIGWILLPLGLVVAVLVDGVTYNFEYHINPPTIELEPLPVDGAGQKTSGETPGK